MFSKMILIFALTFLKFSNVLGSLNKIKKDHVVSEEAIDVGNRLQHDPIIIGHRGASGMYPEHTKLAYREAINQGADYIECDVVVTKDLKLYCNHELWLSQITPNLSTHKSFSNRRKSISILREDPYRDTYVQMNITDWFIHDFTESELKTLKRIQAESNRDPSYNLKEEFCSLQEFINIAKIHNSGIYLEIKYPFFVNSILRSRGQNKTIEELVLKVLEKNSLMEKDSKCLIQSFEKKSLELMRLMTKLRLVYFLWEDPVYTRNSSAKNVLLTNRKMWSSALDWAKQNDIHGFGLDKNFFVEKDRNGYITKSHRYMINEAKENGMLLHVYTFAHDQQLMDNRFPWNFGADPYSEYQFYAGMGVDGLFTDFPAMARRFLNSTGLCS